MFKKGKKSKLASKLGTKGGKSKSSKKQSAARKNGAKGGRPRKVHPLEKSLMKTFLGAIQK